jgi:hypothetical protein
MGMMGLMRHPAFVLLAAWLVVLAASLAGSRIRRGNAMRASRARGPVAASLVAASLATIGAYVVIAIWYASRATFFDPAEPTITAVAWVFAKGQPLYPALDAPERYAHIYGPVLFMAHAAAFAVFGPCTLASKSIGVGAALTGLALAYVAFRKQAGTAAALAATAACVLIYFCFDNVSYWTRSDPMLIAAVAAGLWASCLRDWRASSIIAGVALGLATNLKLTGPVYFLPMLALIASTHGLRAVASAAAIAVPVAGAPFLLPQVSLTHFREYFELSARNGLVPLRMRQNLEWAVFLSAPTAAWLWAARAARPGVSVRVLVDPFVPVLAVAVAIVIVVAAKPGAGPFHLLPFVPLFAYAVLRAPAEAWRRPIAAQVLAACILAALAMAVPRQIVFVTTVMNRPLESAVAELRQFAAAHPRGRMAVGYAGTSYLSFARPELVFRTDDYLLDAPAVQEHRLSGLEIPLATRRAMDTCRIEYWLIPSGGEPFLVPGAYQPDGPREVFPPDFRAAFLARYERGGSTGQFDIWRCSPALRTTTASARAWPQPD